MVIIFDGQFHMTQYDRPKFKKYIVENIAFTRF